MAWKPTWNLLANNRLLLVLWLAEHSGARPFLCPGMDGMSRCHGWQGATHVQGWTVCRGAMDGKERRMSREGGVAMSRDGRTEICSCNFCTSTIHGGRMPQGAREGGAAMPWMDGQKFAPRQQLDLVSSITAPALFYLRASCPNEPFYHLHPCKCPALP